MCNDKLITTSEMEAQRKQKTTGLKDVLRSLLKEALIANDHADSKQYLNQIKLALATRLDDDQQVTEQNDANNNHNTDCSWRREAADNKQFKDFMRMMHCNYRVRAGAVYKHAHYVGTGVTEEVQLDVFAAPADYALVQCVPAVLSEWGGVAAAYRMIYGTPEGPEVSDVAVGSVLTQETETYNHRRIYYLVTKNTACERYTYRGLWDALRVLRLQVLQDGVFRLAMTKTGCGPCGLDYKVVQNMLEEMFRDTGVKILICDFHPEGGRTTKTVDCYFYKKTGSCRNGDDCPYRHRNTKHNHT